MVSLKASGKPCRCHGSCLFVVRVCVGAESAQGFLLCLVEALSLVHGSLILVSSCFSFQEQGARRFKQRQSGRRPRTDDAKFKVGVNPTRGHALAKERTVTERSYTYSSNDICSRRGKRVSIVIFRHTTGLASVRRSSGEPLRETGKEVVSPSACTPTTRYAG